MFTRCQFCRHLREDCIRGLCRACSSRPHLVSPLPAPEAAEEATAKAPPPRSEIIPPMPKPSSDQSTPSTATAAQPGTPEYLEVLAQRAKEKQELKNPNDGYVPKPTED
jgi:hypothetical protein